MPERVVKVNNTPANNENDTVTTRTAGQNAFRDMMDEPAIQDMMKKRQESMVMKRYGKVIDRLDLDDAEKEKLIGLLGDKQLYRMQAFMRSRAATDEDDKANIKALSEEQNLDNDEQIADLLGEKYDTYTDYQEKRHEYEILENLNEKFNDNTLTTEQTDQLADAMKTTANSFEFSNSEVADNPGAFRELSKDDQKIYMTELKERDNLVLEELSNNLSDEQLQQVKKDQKRQRDRLTYSRGGFPGGRRGGGPPK
jgi:parvulin-like peptidyl-prolyl isomerase